MKIYNLFSTLLILLLPGCTVLSQKLQNILEKKATTTTSASLVEQKKVKNYCDNKNPTQSLLEDPQFFSSTLFKNAPLTFIEKSVLIALIELGRRPDITSPYSRLQVLTKLNGDFQYYDFRPKNLDDDSKISFLYGLDFLLKKSRSRYTLGNLAKFLDQTWTSHYLVSNGFEAFLIQHKNDILKNNELSKLYLKGDEVLTRFETFAKPELQKSITFFEKKKLFDNSFYEFSKNNLVFTNTDQQKNRSKCNFDMNKDSFTPDDLSFEKAYASHAFSFLENGNYFMAISSSHLKQPLELKDEFFLKARPAASPLPICHLYNPTLELELVLTSITGRNPSQHIKHLIDYDSVNSSSIETLGHTINFARHLFLTNPDRILYESKRGRKEQLNFFLQMNFPIYHIDQLGEIMAIASYQRDKYHSIIRDDRSTKQLLCTP